MNKTKSLQGFTIIELLIAAVIIAILAIVVFISYSGIQERAAIATLKADLSSAAKVLAADFNFNDSYPSSPEDANGGQGLSQSDGVTFDYTSDGSTYCLTATSSRANIPVYHVSSDTGNIAEGACSGLPAPGGVAATWNACGWNITWSAVSGAVNYTVQLSHSTDFTSPAYTLTGITGTSTFFGSDFSVEYVRVVANSSSGPGAWSSPSAIPTAPHACDP